MIRAIKYLPAQVGGAIERGRVAKTAVPKANPLAKGIDRGKEARTEAANGTKICDSERARKLRLEAST